MHKWFGQIPQVDRGLAMRAGKLARRLNKSPLIARRADRHHRLQCPHHSRRLPLTPLSCVARFSEPSLGRLSVSAALELRVRPGAYTALAAPDGPRWVVKERAATALAALLLRLEPA